MIRPLRAIHGLQIALLVERINVNHVDDADGRPLFINQGGRYRIVGVESATYPNEEGLYDYNMAVDSRAFWEASGQFIN